MYTVLQILKKIYNFNKKKPYLILILQTKINYNKIKQKIYKMIFQI